MSFFWSRIRCWIPKALVFSGLWHFPQSFLFFHDLDNFWRTNRASSRMSLRLGAWQFLAVREHGFLGNHHWGGDVLCASHPFPVTLTLSFWPRWCLPEPSTVKFTPLPSVINNYLGGDTVRLCRNPASPSTFAHGFQRSPADLACVLRYHGSDWLFLSFFLRVLMRILL